MNQPRKRHILGSDISSSDEHGAFYERPSIKTLDNVAELPEDEKTSHTNVSAADGTEHVYNLPYIQAVLFACALEDSITQLRIIDELNNELRIIKAKSDMSSLRAKKFQIEEGQSKDKLASIDRTNIDSNQFKLDKLVSDRAYCIKVMLRTYLDLSLHRSFRPLTASNQSIEDREVYRDRLAEEETRNKTERRDMLKQLRLQRNRFKSVVYDTEVVVDHLKSRVEDATLDAHTTGRYVENWERARTEQNDQSIHDIEAGPSDSIKYYRNRTEQEQRIHSEIELLVNIFIDEVLQEVESWMNKYENDTEAMDLKIQMMKIKCQDILDRRVGLEKKYAEHEVLMDNWVKFKEDREALRLYSLKMTDAAIAVQAWWRGLLVRLELGPYKPKKKKPAAEKKKGKK